jgi:PIN domain nuclease of toxin-antitoxin system
MLNTRFSLARENGIEILPVQFGHTKIVSKLPFHHRDLFDRMIIAQSIFENMPIITADAYFPLYKPQIIW